MDPLVSVVMVVRDVDRFLAESIESILGQTFREFELIIVDFGSTDTSRAIASTYATKDNRIKLHQIPNCGLAEARNAGCFLSKGQYIAIMDADDISVPNRLMLETAFMEKNPRVGVLGGATEWIDAKGRSLHFDFLPAEDHEIRLALASRCPFWQSAVLIRSHAFALVGGYRTAFAQAEDYDLWLRISEHFQCANLREVVLKYRIHPHQISLSKRTQQTLCVLAAQVSAAARRKGFPDPLNQVGEITPEALNTWGVPRSKQRCAVVSHYQQWIRHMCLAGEFPTALKAAREVLQSDLEGSDRRHVADLHITVAGLLWREGCYLSSLHSVGRAGYTRPLVIGRPLKSFLRRLRRVVKT